MKSLFISCLGLLIGCVLSTEASLGALPDTEPGGDAEGARLAIHNPDEFAWQLFFYVNRQALAGTAGKADLTKPTLKDYDPDADVVWETWALASSEATEFAEVFLTNGVPPPDWNNLNRGPRRREKKLDHTFTLIGEQVLRAAGQSPHGQPAAPETDFDSDEVRVNQATLETIKSRGLYNRTGLAEAFAEAVRSQNRDFIRFPTAAKEVKARWAPIAESQKDQFHWKTINGQTYGLMAFHIITKDLPMWYWTDFIHESLESGEPPNSVRDSTSRGTNAPSGQNGVRNETRGGKWEHYRLKGSQVTFNDARGNPVILGNELIESGNARISSCITCHAMAGVDAGGNGKFSPFITGIPSTIQFGSDDDIRRIQTDFLYSIPLRAQATGDSTALGTGDLDHDLRANARHALPANAIPAAELAGEVTEQIFEGFPEHKMQRLQQRAGDLNLLANEGIIRPEFVFRLARRWAAGQTITVAFRGGTPQLHKLIAEQATEWTKHANLRLDFGFNPNTGSYRSWKTSDIEYSAMIRISFDQKGYYSNVGADSIQVSIAPPGEESMNFGGFDQGLPLDWKGTVLHEFGHAIGLEHEHQHPDGGCDFRWENDPGYIDTTGPRGDFRNDSQGRRPGIYTVLGGYPNFWKRPKVDFNLKQLPDSQAFFTTGGLDNKSIMLYFFEPWMFKAGTQSPCYIVNESGVLSDEDMRGAREMFPSTLEGIQRAEKERSYAIETLQKAKTLSMPLKKQLDKMESIK